MLWRMLAVFFVFSGAVFGAGGSAGDLVVQKITASHGMFDLPMVYIPAGTFQRGSMNTLTAVTKGFYMGRYEVTQEQYFATMGYNPSKFAFDDDESRAKRPVESVTWFDAVEFCNTLSERAGFEPVYTITGRTPAHGFPITKAAVTANWSKNGYRLPTEAEWEYACRAGTATAFSFGDNEARLREYAWYNENSNNKTREVGGKHPNPWGLYDMHGNVWEWCHDWLGSLPGFHAADSTGPAAGVFRVERGGGWDGYASYARADCRTGSLPSNRSVRVGFRVVRR